MIRKDLVCGVGWAKHLKDMGLPQESMYYWIEGTTIGLERLIQGGYPRQAGCGIVKKHNICSAYTAGELGLLLPLGVQVWRRFANDRSPQYYWKANFSSLGVHANAQTEADVKANILMQILLQKNYSLQELLDLYEKVRQGVLYERS